MLSGSRGSDELVRWSRYLIDAPTIRLGDPKELAALELVEQLRHALQAFSRS